MTQDQLITHLDNLLEGVEGGIYEWGEKFAADPQHALRWGDAVFTAVAAQAVYRRLLIVAKHREPAEAFTIMRDEALGTTALLSDSTSSCATLLQREEARVLCRLVKDLSYTFEKP